MLILMVLLLGFDSPLDQGYKDVMIDSVQYDSQANILTVNAVVTLANHRQPGFLKLAYIEWDLLHKVNGKWVSVSSRRVDDLRPDRTINPSELPPTNSFILPFKLQCKLQKGVQYIAHIRFTTSPVQFIDFHVR